MSFIVRESGAPYMGIRPGNRFISPMLRMGIVESEVKSSGTEETKYIVMVAINGVDTPVLCTRMVRFGGMHNYEEYTLRSYVDSKGEGVNRGYATRAGDTVVVGFFDGSARNGVILGAIRHAGRIEKLEANNKPAYISRFNGIEKTISATGQLTYTYRGIEKGSEKPLEAVPTGMPMPEAVDSTERGGSTFGFDNEGNFTVTDGDKQSVILNKDKLTGGDLSITSGTTTVKIAGGSKNAEVTVVTDGKVAFTTKKDIALTGASVEIAASKKIDIKATSGISIKSSGNELLDLLITLVDELGALVVSSPTGPCSPLQGAPSWAKVVTVQQKIKAMLG